MEQPSIAIDELKRKLDFNNHYYRVLIILIEFIKFHESVNINVKKASLVTWDNIICFLSNPISMSLVRYFNAEDRKYIFSYEVLAWSGLLGVFEKIVPEDVVFGLQNQYKALSENKYDSEEKRRVFLRRLDDFDTILGSNVYIANLSFFCQLKDPELISNYKGKIGKIDPNFEHTRNYFKFLVQRSVIDESVIEKLSQMV